MKRILTTLIAAAFAAATAPAQTPFAFTATSGSTLSSVAIPATGNEKIRLQYVNATSDAASGALTFYRADERADVLATSATGQKVISAAPYPGAAQDDVVVLHAYATNTAARGVVDTTGSNSITLKANLPVTLRPGDKVYLMVPAGSIAVGAATKEVNAPTVFATGWGPALVDVSGTASCRINLVAGEYR
jgi:hypothetical protein